MDFAAMAARLEAGLEDVRACLLMSRDGLTLGVHPHDGEGRAREAWDRLARIGDPERGFLVVGDEVWVVCRRGSYAGIVVAKSSVLPGLLLDQLESLLRRAEEARAREPATAAQRPEPPRRVRPSLHPEPEQERRVEAPVQAEPAPKPAVPPSPEPAPELVSTPTPEPEPAPTAAPPEVVAQPEPTRIREPEPAPAHARARELIGEAKRIVDVARVEPGDAVSSPPAAAKPAPKPEPKPERKPERDAAEEKKKEGKSEKPSKPARRDPDSEVDPVALAREFSALFRDADGSGT